MYLTNKYVFIHMNKTGGVTVKDWMIKHFGASVHRYKHAPIRMLDSIHHGKTTIGVIRNPFSWYVSYFEYLTQNGILTTMKFPQFIFTYTQHPRALLDFMGKKVRRKLENLYPPRTKLKIGSWTYHYINYFSYDAKDILREKKPLLADPSNLDVLMRTETLTEDMVTTFGEEYRESIENFPRKNVTKRKPYQEYYNDELRTIVEHREKTLMECLGYEF